MPRDKTVRRRRLVFAGLVLISLILLTAFFREPASGALHGLQRGGLGVLSPVQSVATRAVQPFQDGYRWTKHLFKANSENKRLTAEVSRLQGQLVLLQEAKQENQRLRDLISFRDAGIFPEGSTFVVARVVGCSPTKWQAWVQIDKGSADGIRLDQPVVGATPSVDMSLSGKGLVGKVIAVSSHAAQIQLVTDPESSVAAIVQGTENEGRAEGIIEGNVSGRIIMDYVERDQPVALKRIVITAGFGGVYPKGIPVGIVDSVGVEDVNVYKQIEIRPFVDFSNLEEVMVLTSPRRAAPSVSKMKSIVPTGGGSTSTSSTTTTVGATTTVRVTTTCRVTTTTATTTAAGSR